MNMPTLICDIYDMTVYDQSCNICNPVMSFIGTCFKPAALAYIKSIKSDKIVREK